MKPHSRCVRIVQLLCPSRHCIKASAYEAEDGAIIPEVAAALVESFLADVAAGRANPWCGICGAQFPVMRTEDARTRYATMQEALPHLIREQSANIATMLSRHAERN